MNLTPLSCPSCGAGVPLVAAPASRCTFCGAEAPVPPDYVEAARAREAEGALRREVEPRWAALSRPAPRAAFLWGMALVVLLPPIATLLGHLLPSAPLARSDVFGLLTLPALVPGAALWLWAGAVGATVLRYRLDLAANAPARPNEPPSCRSCGGALAVAEGAIAATCGYCGTDSLTADLPRAAASR